MIDPDLRWSSRSKAEVRLVVDLKDSEYFWHVVVRDWSGTYSEQTGARQTAEEAVATAEEVGERIFHEMYTPDVLKFLGMGWRPPA
jgi:hypothetical protein